MKVKRRILSGLLAMSMVAGSFFINTGKTSAADPVPWVPSQADIDFAAAAPTDWAFEVTSVPLHNAILAKYDADFGGTGDVDSNDDGYISKSEACALTGDIDLTGLGISGTLTGVENFTGIINLLLGNNKLTGNIPVNIGNLVNLETFYVAFNQLSGTIPESINQLENMKDLNFGSNQLEGTIPQINGLTKLGIFNVWKNKLTGQLPNSFGDLPLLTELHFGGNSFTGEIPSNLMNLSNLKILQLSSNKFTGVIPDFSRLLLLTNFSVSGNPNLPIGKVEGTDASVSDIITQDAINSAIAELAKFPSNVVTGNTKTSIQAQIDHAQALLTQKEEATDATADLFTVAGDNLATGITETEIAAAEALVTALPSPSDTVTNLQAKIDLARQMLEARDTVDALLTITTDNTNLAAGVTQADITSAQALVTALDDATAGALKIELQAKLDTAQAFLDTPPLVADLFTDNSKTALATSVTQGVITAAKTAVEALPVGDTQDALLADIATAQGLLDAKTLADAKTAAKADLDQKATDAKNAIDALPNLTDTEKTVAKNAVDNALTDAKDAVNLATTPVAVGIEKDFGVTKINDEVTKAEVLDTLNAAKTAAKADLDQKATDAKNAIDALPNLTDPEKMAEKNKVETDLTDAKTAVDVAGDTIAVNNAKNSGDTNITNDLNDAIALDAANLADAKTAAKAELVAKAEAVKNAIDALTSLSTAEKNIAKDAINAELTRGSNAIDAATTIAKVTEEKTTSIANMDKILKGAKALDAKNTVNDLFDNTGKIKDTVNQDVINLAKEKVNGLETGTEKDQLNALIAYAEKQLAERNTEVIKPISKAGSGTQLITNASTGDENNLLMYIIGLLLAMVSVGLILKRKHIKQ